MGHIESSKDLTASPQEVWDVITDASKRGEWLTIHSGWLADPPAELTVGSVLVEKVVMLGMANKIEQTVTVCDAPKRLELSGTGMAGVKVTFAFEIAPNGSGSTVNIAGDFSGSLIVGALGKAVEKDGVANLENSLSNLEKLVG